MRKSLIPFLRLIFLSIVLSSCTINGSFQGLRSYYPETVKVNPDLFVYLEEDQLICDTTGSYTHKVVIANAQNLKECIAADSSVVYIWGANCKGTECKGLNESQEMTSQANANLFVVAEYYDAELMDLNHLIDYPIIGIDTRHYKSEWTKKYLSRFLSELTGENTDHSSGRFFVFFDGKMTGRYRTMESALVINGD